MDINIHIAVDIHIYIIYGYPSFVYGYPFVMNQIWISIASLDKNGHKNGYPQKS